MYMSVPGLTEYLVYMYTETLMARMGETRARRGRVITTTAATISQSGCGLGLILPTVASVG